MSIKAENLSYTYSKKSPYQKKALENLSFCINDGDFYCICGHTGSGKSTLLQHFNGLIKLTEGKLKVLDFDLNVRRPDYKALRFSVGMVFQYPEYQLFDDTAAKDIAYGPRNMKLSAEEIDKRVRRAVERVGLSYEEICDKSPFELSGGQKRRVAIAGVIAMEPKILVLDEPTAGLDPLGKQEILRLVMELKQTVCQTVVMVTHDMDIVASYATRVGVLENGKLVFDGTPVQLFQKGEELKRLGLDLPVAKQIANQLCANDFDISPSAITPEGLVEEIIRNLQGGEHA